MGLIHEQNLQNLLKLRVLLKPNMHVTKKIDFLESA